MPYRKAIPSEITEIRKLWEEVFGDLDDYIRKFISHFGIENCYVFETNHKIVAMAFAIPTSLKSPSKFQNLRYLYACATHPDFQGQGIMAKLLETVYDEACKENFAGIFLQAINQSLAEYYQKLGFEEFFFREHSFYYSHDFQHKEHKECTKDAKKISVLCENTSRPLRLKNIDLLTPENYRIKRSQKLNSHYFVNWEEGFFRFLNETETNFCEYKDTIFSFKAIMNNIVVDELLGDTPKEQIALLLFEELPNFDAVHIRSPLTANCLLHTANRLQQTAFCCGQIKWCKPVKEKFDAGRAAADLGNCWFAFAME